MVHAIEKIPDSEKIECFEITDYCDEAESRILRGIPGDIQEALTPEQILRLLWAVKPVPTKHGLALRASFRFFAKRYYLACFGGEDCRNVERLRAEGQLDAVPVGITLFLLLGLIAIYGIFPLVILLYLVKSWLGINFFDGPSALHLMLCN